MNLSLDNTSFWAILAVWAMVVFTVATVLVKWVVRKPRFRAAILLAALTCTLLPFVADRLPAVQASQFGLISTQPLSTTFVQLPPVISNSGQAGSTVPAPACQPIADPFPWTVTLVSLWLLGACIAGAFLLWQIFKMNRLARTGHAAAPMVAGFPVSKILFPAEWPNDLTSDEAEAAMAHEQVHLRGLHVQGRVFVELFRCFFWWLPTVHLTAKLYEQALEEIADSEALRQVKPEALANALVKAAQLGHINNPGLATGATSNGKHLEVRLKRIMDNQTSGRWPLAALIAFSSIGLAFAAAPRLANEQQSVGVKPIFAMTNGTSWTYDISYGTEKNPYEMTVNKVSRDGDLLIYEMTTKAGRDPGYLYRAVGADGLYVIGNRSMMGPGYDKSDIDPMIKGPYRKGTSWKWHSPFRGQTMMGPDGKAPNMADFAHDCVGTIEGEENITVKAGTFRCFRVHITQTSKASGMSDYTDWISLDAGLVKRTIPARKNVVAGSWELVRFNRGNPIPTQTEDGG